MYETTIFSPKSKSKNCNQSNLIPTSFDSLIPASKGGQVGLSLNNTHLTVLDNLVQISTIAAIDQSVIGVPYKPSHTKRTPRAGKNEPKYVADYRAKKKIRDRLKYLYRISDGKLSMITLTYSAIFPQGYEGHAKAMRHLDLFIKKANRHCNRKFMYVVVAETQERGAIHFHIVTPNYIDMNWLNKAWTSIVNKHWLSPNGYTYQKMVPNLTSYNKKGNHDDEKIYKYLRKGNLKGLQRYVVKGSEPKTEDPLIDRKIYCAIHSADTATSKAVKEDKTIIQAQDPNEFIFNFENFLIDNLIPHNSWKDRNDNIKLFTPSLSDMRIYLSQTTKCIDGKRTWLRSELNDQLTTNGL